MMSVEEKIEFRRKVCEGLARSFEQLLRRKAALGQDMVFADEHGQPRIVPAREALEKFLSTGHV